MPIPIALIALFVAYAGGGFYPHWAAYVAVALVPFVMFIAYRVWIVERRQRNETQRHQRRPYCTLSSKESRNN